MDNPETPTAHNNRIISQEAITGTGITVGALGVLCLLLGCAQWMRLEHGVATVCLILGAVLVAIGALTALVGRARDRS